MSETRQFIIFMLCVVNLLVAGWTLSEVAQLRGAVDGRPVNYGDCGEK